MDPELLKKHAQVVLKVGVNLQPGQNLLIDAEPIHLDLVKTITQEAYKLGARFVKYHALVPDLLKKRINYSVDEHLDYASDLMPQFCQPLIDEDWAIISIGGLENPDLLADVDPQRLMRVRRVSGEAGKFIAFTKNLLPAVMAAKIQWCCICSPTPGWAAKIFNTEADPAAQEKLWREMLPLLRLDSPDPIAAWETHRDLLKQKCQLLDDKQFEYLHFVGPGTDLKVYPIEGGNWWSSIFTTPKGIEFVINLPTEEVVITPDYRKTEGRVACTKPVNIMGRTVEEAWLEFKEGRVVDFGARVGKDALGSLLKTDEGASYLGEVALVGADSPIYQSGLIFHTILLDENAACHIGLGKGYPPEYAKSYSPEELKNIGCNDSLIHRDVMIGSDEVSVFGGHNDGFREEIIKAGKFVI